MGIRYELQNVSEIIVRPQNGILDGFNVTIHCEHNIYVYIVRLVYSEGLFFSGHDDICHTILWKVYDMIDQLRFAQSHIIGVRWSSRL